MSSVVALACFAVAALVGFLAFECLFGAGRCAVAPPKTDAPSFTVLMPAHDEASIIAGPINAVMAQLRCSDRLVVIADNCSDDTAEIARSLGATVLERSNPDLRGKGHALEFGRAGLGGISSEVVIIVDADCIAEPGALEAIAATCASRGAVVQGSYGLIAKADASTKVRISCFAFMIKNLIRQNAVQTLSGFALLQGTGMAFPRAVFDRIEWRAESLVEDLDMGIDLVLAGIPVVFDPSAAFLSDASSEAATAGQRRRWEHGFLRSMGRNVPALLRKAFAGRWRLAFMALNLMIPPTVMLIALASIVLVLGLSVLGLASPVWALLSALALLAIGLLRAWHVHGRDILPLRSIAGIPGYMAWKLPIAVQFFTRRESEWTRTERGQ